MDDMPELNLVAESIQQGDFEAYKRWFVRYYAVVRTFVGGFVKDEEVAKDIAQDVFMKLWQYRNDCAFFRSGDGFSSFTPIEDYGIYINPMAVGKGTDWIEEITRIAPYQNYNVSLLGRVKNFRYFSSLGYTNKRGIIDGSGVQRATGRINVDYDVSNGCRLVQTLRYVGAGYSNAFDWCVDCENGYIYTYGNTPQKTVLINRFRLPEAFAGDVTLTERDVLWSAENHTIKIYQGSTVYRNMMFCPDGTYPIHRRMHIINLHTGEEEECFDISHLLYEPEGVCVSDGYLYLVLNTCRGRLYRFKLINK